MEKNKYYRCEPKDDGLYRIKELNLYGAGKNCFLTKEEAVKHYEKAEKKASKKYEKIMEGLQKLKNSVGNFSYDCEATAYDDTGLETQMYIEFYIDGYNFRYNQ